MVFAHHPEGDVYGAITVVDALESPGFLSSWGDWAQLNGLSRGYARTYCCSVRGIEFGLVGTCGTRGGAEGQSGEWMEWS